MKRSSLLIASFLMLMMVFGIGVNIVSAANTNTAKPAAKNAVGNANTNLQPAAGQSEYRAMDGAAGSAGTSTTVTAAPTAENTATKEDTGIVGMFGLNWKLFLAQLINFGIILFVLWKWVFGPVTKGLSQRTEKIENSLADAQKITEERETFDSWKQGEIGKVRAEASAIISQAKSDAEKLKTDTLEKTKEEQNKIIANAQVKLEAEKQAMLDSAKNELAEIVVDATEKIIKQKLDAKKDAALIDQALKEASRT